MQLGYVSFDTMSQMMSVFGSFDAHVKTIEQALGVVISARDSQAEIRGEEDAVKVAIDTIEALKRMHDHGETIGDWAVSQAMDLVRQGDVNDALSAMTDVIAVTYKGKPVKCKTIGQKNYIKAIKEHTVTICIGPAGTGKTYLAMAMAVNALKRKEISRIILTRPAVEAGERLGFLPGDLQQKVDPYLRPLYDALFDFLGQEQAHRMLETGVIEVAPLAYMRGRTLSDCLVILDEGQNAALETLKMVLTRFGEGAKVVINGDVTQIDLPQEKSSGLKQCAEMLKGIDDIAVVTLNNRDVVRHKLVKEIIKAFEKHEAKEQNRQQGQNRGQYQRKG